MENLIRISKGTEYSLTSWYVCGQYFLNTSWYCGNLYCTVALEAN